MTVVTAVIAVVVGAVAPLALPLLVDAVAAPPVATAAVALPPVLVPVP